MSNEIKKLKEERLKKSFIRGYKHLYGLNDLTLIVLKGHLLVEEEINELLNVLLEKPNALKEGNFSFYQKLCILRAILNPKYLPDKEWKAMEQLNNLRNRLAHHLEPKGIKDMVSDFLDKCDYETKEEKSWKEGSVETRLKMFIAELCGKLVGICDGICSP